MSENTTTNGINTQAGTYHPALHEPEAQLRWHVLWTRSNFEKPVCEQLSAKGYEVFLPMMNQWVRGGGKRRITRVPMFKGYLFIHHTIDKESYINICKTNGLVSILGPHWDRLAAVPDQEIETIKVAVQSQMPSMPYPYLEKGDRVRIKRGSLASAEGVLVESDETTGLLVISVNLLRRSIAVQVDCADVVPA